MLANAKQRFDWPRHARWIPATRMEVPTGEATAVGAELTAFTGYGPLTLEDRMRITRCDWDEAGARGDCEVEKLGPVLQGRAGFTVRPEGRGCAVTWLEDVTVPYVPAVLAPVVSRLSALGFRLAMRRLVELVER